MKEITIDNSYFKMNSNSKCKGEGSHPGIVGMLEEKVAYIDRIKHIHPEFIKEWLDKHITGSPEAGSSMFKVSKKNRWGR